MIASESVDRNKMDFRFHAANLSGEHAVNKYDNPYRQRYEEIRVKAAENE